MSFHKKLSKGAYYEIKRAIARDHYGGYGSRRALAEHQGVSTATIYRISKSKDYEDYHKNMRKAGKEQRASTDLGRAFQKRVEERTQEGLETIKRELRETEEAKAMYILVKSGFLKVEVKE